MTKLHFLLFSRCGLFLLALAATLPAHSATFAVKDPHLKQCLEKISSERQWQTSEAFTEIECHNMEISSLEGIDSFQNITKLSLYKNNLTEVSLSGLKHLKHLNVAKNALNKIQLDGLTQLSELYLFNNNLQQLQLNNMPILESLKANSNQLTAVSFTRLEGLSKIYLFDNKLEHLDIKTLPALKYMDVRHNPMPDEFYDFLDSQPGLTALHDGNSEDWQ